MASDDDWTREHLLRAQRGDIEAYGAIVERHQADLRGFLAWLGVPVGERVELAQEVFVDAFVALRSCDAEQGFLTWLRGVARNRVRRLHRRRVRAARLAPLDAIAATLLETADGESPEDRGDLLRRLRACVQELPRQAAALVRLRYLEELDSTAIAERIGGTATGVRMALVRARKRLRRCIEMRQGNEAS